MGNVTGADFVIEGGLISILCSAAEAPASRH